MKNPTPKRPGVIIIPYFAMAMMGAAMGEEKAFGIPKIRERENELKGVDITREYHLIQQKKSGLSRRLRERVVAIYESRQL